MTTYSPKVVCFSCSFGWGYLAEAVNLAERIPNWVPVVCGGKIEAEQILAAFRRGADGVLVAVCGIGECHFQDGNLQLGKRVSLLKTVLAAQGIAADRLQVIFSRDPAGDELPRILLEFSRHLTDLGPLQITW